MIVSRDSYWYRLKHGPAALLAVPLPMQPPYMTGPLTVNCADLADVYSGFCLSHDRP